MNHEPQKQPKSQQLDGQEVAKHNNDSDCWVIIHGKAYDVTEFKEEHPGGKQIILKWAGKDATETYDPIHPPDTLDKFLDQSKHLGEVNMETVQQDEAEVDPDEVERQERLVNLGALFPPKLGLASNSEHLLKEGMLTPQSTQDQEDAHPGAMLQPHGFRSRCPKGHEKDGLGILFEWC